MTYKTNIIHLKALVRSTFFDESLDNHTKEHIIVELMMMFGNERIMKTIYKYVQYLQRNNEGPVHIDLHQFFPGDSLPFPHKCKHHLNADVVSINPFNQMFVDACEVGDIDTAIACVERGADDYRDGIRKACLNGNVECTEMCIEYAADEYEDDDVMMDVLNIGLICACSNDHVQCMQLCLDAGANEFSSAISHACNKPYSDVCAITCMEKANEELDEEDYEELLEDSLDTACFQDHLVFANWCIEHGATCVDMGFVRSCCMGALDCAKLCLVHGATAFKNGLKNADAHGHVECANLCIEYDTTRQCDPVLVKKYGYDVNEDVCDHTDAKFIWKDGKIVLNEDKNKTESIHL
jgi:ankyrin repeat protein